MTISPAHAIVELLPPAGAGHLRPDLRALTIAPLVQHRWGAPRDAVGLPAPVGLVVLHHDDGLKLTGPAELAAYLAPWTPPVYRQATPAAPAVVVLLPAADAALQAHYLTLGVADVLTAQTAPAVLRARLAQLLRLAAENEVARKVTEHLHKDRELSEKIINLLVPISVELTTETNFDLLLEKILNDGMNLCGAEGGTIYVRTALDTLCFMLVRNRVLNLCVGGPGAPPITFAPLPLYEHQQVASRRYVACVAATGGQTIHIPDIYASQEFDFAGTRTFDRANNYRSCSMVAVPLKTREGRVSGVLQLINARDPETQAVVAFDPSCLRVIESLAKVAAAALESCRRLQQLRLQVAQMSLDVDAQKIEQEVRQITESDSFRTIKEQARALRARRQLRTLQPVAG